jgi:predicted nucleic-acid-binding protein
MNANTVFLSRTVLLETEWVLRVHYRKDRSELAAFFGNLLDTDNTIIEDSHHVSKALEWYRLGADFADALHLAVCGTVMMHTFDRGFCKAARLANKTPEIRILEVDRGQE